MHACIVFIITQMMGMADSSITVKQTKMQPHKEFCASERHPLLSN